jgi:glycerol kinase
MAIILSIDQGTTGSQALLMNERGTMLAEASLDYPQYYPKGSWVEHQALDIKNSVENSVKLAIEKAGIKASHIDAIGISNQRETICVFDHENNAPFPFIVWQCRRSADICKELAPKREKISEITGLSLDPYFSASKILWLMREHAGLAQKLKARELLVGTIESFLCHWLSAGELHISDATNASRTMLMDLKSCAWSDYCLDSFSIPKNCLPDIVKNCGPYGKTKGLKFLPDGIPIAAMIGDQQSALFGHACFDKGEAKATFGTGAFILLNSGREIVHSEHGLLSSVASYIHEVPDYCLEGSVYVAGAAVQFFTDSLPLFSSAQEIEDLAKSAHDSNGITFIPALCGLGAPHWQPEARGALFGLTRGSSKAELARALLEGVALQNADVLDAMADDGCKPKELRVDGGASQNDLLMQIHADVTGIKCLRSDNGERTALGAAYLAGLAVGIFANKEQIRAFNHIGHEFFPNNNNSYAQKILKSYRSNLKAIMGI